MNETKKKVLIIEDDKFVRDSLAELLKTWGFETTWADNEQDALKEIVKGDYALITLDMKLGNTSGLEILKSIRKTNRNMPVIIITAYENEEKTRSAIKEGISYLLPKPISPLALKHIIKEIINKEKGGEENGKCKN